MKGNSDRKTILMRVQRVRETGPAPKKKRPGRAKCVKTKIPNHCSIEQSSKSSAQKRVLALKILEGTVRQILLTDLHLHPYKIMIN